LLAKFSQQTWLSFEWKRQKMSAETLANKGKIFCLAKNENLPKLYSERTECSAGLPKLCKLAQEYLGQQKTQKADNSFCKEKLISQKQQNCHIFNIPKGEAFMYVHHINNQHCIFILSVFFVAKLICTILSAHTILCALLEYLL
jgi:hypothetical protein